MGDKGLGISICLPFSIIHIQRRHSPLIEKRKNP